MPYRGARSFEDKENALFQVDPLLSIEFFETVKKRTCQDPERALMLAVLQDAITCLEKYREFGSGENKRVFDEAKDWIFSDDSDWLFSFNSVCEAVGLNAGYLRSGLIKMSERRSASSCDRKIGKSDQRSSKRALEKPYVGGHSVWPTAKGYAPPPRRDS